MSNCLYGLSAEFDTPEALLEAAKKAKADGYNDVEAYSPFEVHGMNDVLGNGSPLLGWLILAALIIGAVAAFGLQYWTNAIHYVLNVGGRPLNSWPAFTIIMFEGAILSAGLVAAGFMFVTTGLPAPYHPIFNTRDGDGISRNRFFLCIQVTDAKFSMRETRQFLKGLEPIKVSEVTC
jgi:hypothetical protein